jgi:steroid delta-isomerase-like uncharacterized protein
MSVDETKEIMMGYFSGHNSEALAKDAVFTMMSDGTDDKGREAIAQKLQYFYSVAFDAQFEAIHTVFGDGHAFTEGYMVGKHIGEFAGIPATGKDVRVPMCVSYDVENGQIQRARVYFLMASLLAQLGKM